ncbi:MAG: hypothetical protein AB9842_07310 [Bacteroidales bacterium]
MKTSIMFLFRCWVMWILLSVSCLAAAQTLITCAPPSITYSTGTVTQDQETWISSKSDDLISIGAGLGFIVYYGWAVFDVSQIPDAATILSIKLKAYTVFQAGPGNDMRIVSLSTDPVTGSADNILAGMGGTDFDGPNYMMQSAGYDSVMLNGAGIASLMATLSSGSDNWGLGFYEYGYNDPFGTLQGYTSGQLMLEITYNCLLPEVSAIVGPDSVCDGDVVSYAIFPLNANGSNWTVPAGWTILNGQGSFNISVAAGNSGGLVSTEPFNDCGTAAALTVSVWAAPFPSVNFAAQPPVCIYTQPFALTGGTPVGGIYSGPGVNSATGMFDPAMAGSGTHTLSYWFANGPCTEDAVTTIFVDLCLGITQESTEKKMQVLPNPNNGSFSILLPDIPESMEALYILDVSGRLIHTIKLPMGVSTLPCAFSYLCPGIYHLWLPTHSASFRKMMVVSE